MRRRDAVRLLGAAPLGIYTVAAQNHSDSPLAAGAPNSPERMALIESFRQQAATLTNAFEARVHKPVDGWAMPYRLFLPELAARSGKLPLVVYLHGAGGLGSDNQRQIAGGNLPGTRIWLLPANQKRYPCYVVAPQTDRGWVRTEEPRTRGSRPKVTPGFGLGAKVVVDIIDALRSEHSIDERRIYVTGNSMGGGGSWHMVAHRSSIFAAAVPVCGGKTAEDGSESHKVPVWNFHGDSDKVVPVAVSRERIAARRKAGGTPLYTEYSGVGHNVGQWAYTEPSLLEWLFAQRK